DVGVDVGNACFGDLGQQAVDVISLDVDPAAVHGRILTQRLLTSRHSRCSISISRYSRARERRLGEMMRPSDHRATKMLNDAHIGLLRGRRKPAPRPAPRAN